MSALADRKVRTLDDSLRLFQRCDLKSPVIAEVPEDADLQLGASSEIEGREWIEAILPDGATGYVLSASVRSHAEIATGSDERAPGDGQLGLENEHEDASVPHTTVSFSSSTGNAACAALAALCWTILIVTASRGQAEIYAWLCRSLRFSDGTTARFTGNPKNIWFPAMLVVLIPQADKWISRIIASQTDDGAARTVLIWTFFLCLWISYAVLYIRIFRWAVGGISLSSGTVLSFDGGALACFKLACASYVFGALAAPTLGFIFLAFPVFIHWYFRWWIGHVHGGCKRLRFVGSLTQTWWRVLAAMTFSVLIVTIPSALIWLYKWVTANIRIESESVSCGSRRNEIDAAVGEHSK